MKELVEKIKESPRKRGRGTLIIIGSKDFRHGTGRSAVAEILAKELDGIHYSTGDKFREMAKNKGMTITEYVEYVGRYPEIDREFDRQVKREVEGLVSSGKIVVADSNLLIYFTKPDVSILLDAPDELRGKRVYEKHRPADARYKSPEDALEHLRRRDFDDMQRYKKLYGIDAQQLSKMYDFQVINDGPLEETVRKVLQKICEKMCEGDVDDI